MGMLSARSAADEKGVMAEFSAQDLLRPRYAPELKGRAIRLFIGLAIALVVIAIVGYAHLAWFQLTDNGLLMLLAVGGPVATAALMLAASAVVSIGAHWGPFLFR